MMGRWRYEKIGCIKNKEKARVNLDWYIEIENGAQVCT